MQLPAMVTVIYDCWTPPRHRGRGVYPAVLSNLQPLVAGQELWIYCHARNESSARGIQKAGFVLAERLGRTVWFGRFRSGWRRPVPGRDPAGALRGPGSASAPTAPLPRE